MGMKIFSSTTKGRVSLYSILKSMGVGKGDEVIIPAYTCVVVPNPIIYLGAKPIYVEIDSKTYNMDIELLKSKISDKTKVIIAQNTYGYSSNVDQIVEIAKEHNIFTVEDCTHGFGGTYKGKPNGSYCDAAFYSMQWNKPFSSGLGGFLAVNNKKLVNSIYELEKNKIEPKLSTKISIKLLILVRRYLINRFTYWIMVNFYRWLSKNNLVVGSSTGDEISDVKMAPDFFMDYTEVQAKEGYRNIKRLKELIKLRKDNAKLYTDYLKSNSKSFIPENQFENHSFLKYPILVRDRDRFNELARKAKIELGDWFNSPIHPVKNGFEKWHLNVDDFPIAKSYSSKVVNIPTDTKKPDLVIAFLERNLEEIL